MSTTPVIGRLAPSPTGAQHVGNARTYLLAWLSARSRGGRIVLRIEDLDSPRVKAGAAEQAMADLRWLGLDWDEGPDVGGPRTPYVQTLRLDRYRAALQDLQRLERVYPCTCTRADVASAGSAPHVGQEGAIYPGTCAARQVADSRLLVDRPYAWRFRGSDQLRAFDDRVAGRVSANVAVELGDFIVGRSDGSIAYQLAVVVDDHEYGVTEVVRGNDLLASTFRQLDLYEVWGWEPPVFAHVPLVVGPDGRRLAKRHGDTRLSVLREAGRPAEPLIGLLAWSCGLRPTAAPIAPRDLVDHFSMDRVPRESFVLTDAMWRGLQ